MSYPNSYCLSKRKPESCKLQFNIRIMIVVVACNLLKALCMGLALWWRSSSPLLTLGDDVASFLDEPDENTGRNCLAENIGLVSICKSLAVNLEYLPVSQQYRPNWYALLYGAQNPCADALSSIIIALVIVCIIISTIQRRPVRLWWSCSSLEPQLRRDDVGITDISTKSDELYPWEDYLHHTFGQPATTHLIIYVP